MAKVGTQRAAELTGKSKSTIQRAMKSGKISYEMDKSGRRVVDVAELDRAFGLAPKETEEKKATVVEAELEKAKQMLEIERLKMKIKFLEEQLDAAQDMVEDLKSQRTEWQKQAQQVLITSQYSQKQAEEYKSELKERERRAREHRQKELERRMQKMKSQGKNQNQKPGQKTAAGGKQTVSSKDGKDGKNAAGIHGLWQKLRGQDEEAETKKVKATA